MNELNLPDHILQKIVEWEAAGQNSLIISRLVEQNFGEEIAKLKCKIPSYTAIDRYIKEIKKNRPAAQQHVDQTNTAPTFDEFNAPVTSTLSFEGDNTSNHKLSSFDKQLTGKISLTSVKDTNRELKERITQTIARLEEQRTQRPSTWSDKDEILLQKYYVELGKHNLAEIKVADALKDQDILDTQTVVFFISKLFSSLKIVIDRYVLEENRQRFILDLQKIIESTGDEGAKTILKKLKVED